MKKLTNKQIEEYNSLLKKNGYNPDDLVYDSEDNYFIIFRYARSITRVPIRRF